MKNLVEIRPGRILAIHCVNENAGLPVIICIHGLGGRARQWSPLAEQLKQDYTIIMPDLLGHGKSPYIQGEKHYDYYENLKDIEAIYQKYKGKQTIIIGHSYGGAFATALTNLHKNEIEKLILICPVPAKPHAAIPPIYKLPAWCLAALRPLLEKIFKQLAFSGRAKPKLVEHEIEEGRHNRMPMIHAFIHSMKHMPTINVRKIPVQTLLITANQDRLVLPRMSINFYGHLPNVSKVSIEGVGHLPQLEKPRELANIIRNFLENRT